LNNLGVGDLGDESLKALAAAFERTQSNNPAESVGLEVLTLIHRQKGHSTLALILIWRRTKAYSI